MRIDCEAVLPEATRALGELDAWQVAAAWSRACLSRQDARVAAQ